MAKGWKRVWGLFGADGELKTVSEDAPGDEKVDVEAIARGGSKVDESDELRRLREENERLKATAKGQPPAEQLARDAAAAWADGLVASEKVTPAEKGHLAGLYERAALDDIASPIAGGKSRVDLLKAEGEARPKLNLTREQVSVADLPRDAQVLPPHKGDQPKATEPTPEGEKPSGSRMDHLLGLTDKGREVLASRK